LRFRQGNHAPNLQHFSQASYWFWCSHLGSKHEAFKHCNIQMVQNCALRLITGCHQASSIDHLHSKVKILPVGKRLDMLCLQFLASAIRLSHPSHHVLQLPPGARRNKHGRPMKKTLAFKYMHELEPYLNENGVIPEISNKKIIDSIHTEAVQKAIAEQGPNPLLGRIPPPVSVSERSLPCEVRITLSQLRSTHCSALKSYQKKIKIMNDDTCPESLSAPQTVLHLFMCPSHPIQLNPIDLWKNPVTMAKHLLTISTFGHLPPLIFLLPPPPP
jgi:hypothetical protein